MSSRCLTDKEILLITKGLISAVNVIHYRNIAHSHINPKTILINFNGRVGLSGLAYIYDHEKEENQLNKLNYCSPEQIISDNFGLEADV